MSRGVGAFSLILFFVCLSGIASASGGGVSFTAGADCVSPFDSFASTFWLSVGGCGRGTVATSVALIAPPPPEVVPPQLSPELWNWIHPVKMIASVNATCRVADTLSPVAQCSCSSKISARTAILLGQRLSDDTYVGDTGLLHRVHDGSESAEGHVFVSPQENCLSFRIANLLANFLRDVMDVDGIVAEVNPLLLVNGDHQAFFGDLF